jgi:hypothetical protein
MVCGVCRLCRQEKELVSSHWIAAAILKTLRAEDLKNPNPVVADFVVSEQTSRQMQETLLCRQCDNMFGEKGENWVTAHMYTLDSFRLKEILHALTPTATTSESVTYAVGNVLAVDIEKLAYFALSVVWRAAVQRWRTKGGLSTLLELGPYEEEIRAYLLGNKPFPENITLFVGVWYGEKPRHCVITPHGDREETFMDYYLYVPGITFYLLVGKRVPEDMQAQCSYRNKLIHSALPSDENCENLLRDAHQKSRPAMKLAKFLASLKQSGKTVAGKPRF